MEKNPKRAEALPALLPWRFNAMEKLTVASTDRGMTHSASKTRTTGKLFTVTNAPKSSTLLTSWIAME